MRGFSILRFALVVVRALPLSCLEMSPGTRGLGSQVVVRRGGVGLLWLPDVCPGVLSLSPRPPQK